jgi:tetratricopeptide (TPR) repeat protein
LVFATLFAYWPALRGTLLWDDEGHITRPELQSWHGLGRIWFELGATQQYYPLLHSAFWVEHRLWGDAVLGYHLTNTLLHAASALLLVAILRRLTVRGAWLAGFIFALHPVAVNSVAWIAEQKSTLSALFYLSSALVYLRFDQTRRKSHYFVALGLFVLALLTKTATATLPAALLVILWWRRGRLTWERDVRLLLPWLVLGAIAGLFTSWVERNYIGAQGSEFALTMLERCLLAGRAIWFYLAKLAWPTDLVFVYPHWTIDSGVWWQYLFPLGVLALTTALWLLARRFRGPLAGFLYFAGTLFPVLGFLNVYPFVYSYVSDHFQYLASLGIVAIMASGLVLAFSRLPVSFERSAPVFASVLLATLGVMTWRLSATYRDVETLYRYTLRHNPSAWLAENNLGTHLLRMGGRLPEGMAHIEAALRIKPNSPEAHHNLGYALALMPGRRQDAIREYETALRIRPNFPEAHDSLGALFTKVPGRMPDAISHFEQALRLRPEFPTALARLGAALSDTPGRLPEAISDLQAALRLDPNLAEAHNDLGIALSQIPGRSAEAMAHFEIALRINPDYSEAHNNLGSILIEMPGRREEAMAHFREALRINPDSAETHMNLGKALAKDEKRLPEAISEYQEALRIDPTYGAAHNNLALLLADLPGRLPEAISHFEAALKSDPNSAGMRIMFGNALSAMPGRRAEAIAQYEAAVRIDPNLPEAHYVLGLALVKIPGRMPEAIRELEVGVRIQPDPEVQQVLNGLLAARP